MKILCTGGAGYVGSANLRYLLRKGHDAHAFDNLSAGNRAAVPDAAKRLILGDLSDLKLLTQTISDLGIEAVMHFAAVASVPDSIADPKSYWQINLIGTKNVLDAMLENGVKKLVFSSTAATYAFTDQMPLTEQSLQQPVTPYGTTKLACETMIEEYRKAYGIGYSIMRYFNASGADADGEFGEDRSDESHLIPLCLYVPLGRRDKLKVFGKDWPTRDGSCVRDYVHNDDIAQAHALAVEAIEPGRGSRYNLGTNAGVTVLEVLRACEKVVGEAIPFEYDDPRPGDPATLIASSDKVKQELGWKPQYESIESIVETAWRWHSKYPSGYHDKS